MLQTFLTGLLAKTFCGGRDAQDKRAQIRWEEPFFLLLNRTGGTAAGSILHPTAHNNPHSS